MALLGGLKRKEGLYLKVTNQVARKVRAVCNP